MAALNTYQIATLDYSEYINCKKNYLELCNYCMDRLEAMRVFAEVARQSSFSAAARTLGQSLATVSRKVALLEAHLDVQLFVRNTRSVRLTVAGGNYLSGVQPLMSDLAKIESEVAEVEHALLGNLTITTPGPFGRSYMVPLIADFLGAHPGISIRHIFDNTRLDYVNAGIDLGLRIGRLRDSGLKLMKLGEVRVVVCASPEYIEKYGSPKDPGDLTLHKTVAYGPFGERLFWNFADSQHGEIKVEIEPVYRVDSIDAIIRFAVEGGGIGIFYSYQVADHVAAGRLKRLLINHEVESRPVSFLFPDVAFLPTRVRSFLDFATPQLKKTICEIEDLLHC